ncbi:MAG: aldo/keto reductase [Ruminococcus sp.]|nr:aldo/keto reductase [Ruminococcus sp.]
MKYVKFQKTNLEVTPVCLGTVNYGSDLPEKDSIRQLYEFTEMGGNFIDTAHVYGDWNPGDGPLSEITIGKWLAESKKRDQIIISTKGAHPDLRTMSVPRCSNEEIAGDLDASLKALQTDYVDMYFLHRDDPRRPAGEIIEFLESKVKEGKIRYYGCSNWSLARMKEADEYAKKHGLTGFTCNQLMWSLPDINFDNLDDKTFILMDQPTFAYHKEENKNAMAYMAMAKGYYAKRMAGKEVPYSIEKIYKNEVSESIYELLKEVVNSESTITDYVLKYLQIQPFPTVPIVSCNNYAQLESAMHSIEAECDEKVLAEIQKLKKLF